MKHLSEYRDPTLAAGLIRRIIEVSDRPVTLMEVCGTHTVAISKSGLRQLMPESLRLISGPGCPVCVTANRDLDYALAIAGLPGVIVATFGDMMKVPGSYTSFAREKAGGADIRVVYSTLDALKIARQNPQRKVVFFGVGFETTAPTIALSMIQARREGISNYSVFGRHKVVPPAMIALLGLGEVRVDGFICPGHVSTIIGSYPYEPVAEKGAPCVIVGFEMLDILRGIYMLIQQVRAGVSKVEIEYDRVVRPEGNPEALKVMDEVFEIGDADWRGIGVIPETGLLIREKYGDFDAERLYEVDVPPSREPKGCSCGAILRGVMYPYECKLFAKACTPENPIGPCMVSSEGACAAYYRYDRLALKV